MKETFGRSKPPEPPPPAPETAPAAPPPAVHDGAEYRRAARRRVLLTGRIVHSPAEMTVECAILNMSQTGARIRMGDVELLADPVYLIEMRSGLAFRAIL